MTMNNQQDDDQVFFLYTQLMEIPFSQVESIIQIERSLYQELNQNPQDRLALIGLLQAEQMLGNYEKAKSFAYKIWDLGEGLSITEEFLYTNSLINIGLLEMAAALLKPKFENLSQYIKKYYPVMLKYSTMTGNVSLLERLLLNPQVPYQDEEYKKIVKQYQNYNYSEHFKSVMQVIQESVIHKLCACEYDIKNDIMPELEIYLYLSGEMSTIEEIKQNISQKLENLYQTRGIEKLSNFRWQLYPISKHQPMGL